MFYFTFPKINPARQGLILLNFPGDGCQQGRIQTASTLSHQTFPWMMLYIQGVMQGEILLPVQEMAAIDKVNIK